jgi:HAD superfamily phosphatase (TIGR01668 family)
MLVRPKSASSHSRKTSLFPDFICETVAGIDFDYLKSNGINACFVDLDGTVVKRGEYDVAKGAAKAFQDSGLKVYIATNRPKSRSLKNLKEDLHADGVIHPAGLFGKPTKKYFKNGLKTHWLKPSETVMIGDRYIQDILGANRAGMYSLVVYKLGGSKGRIDTFISSMEKRLTLSLSGKYRRAK